MMVDQLRFLTKNEFKFQEFKKLFEGTDISILKDSSAIEEIQTEDMIRLVEDKVIKAFDKIRHPVFVDHTGLKFDLLNGFPGGLTEIFWESLENIRLSQLIGQSDNPAVTATTYIGYCDGKAVHTFSGEIRGSIAPKPRGPDRFQWDPVFVPDGYDKTFSEMGDQKNEISMRRLAINNFIEHLRSTS